jgi:CHAT domain-containing protein
MERQSQSDHSAQRGFWATLRAWRTRNSRVHQPDDWEGTGFRFVQERVERATRGIDGEAARQLGSQAFAAAREADRITEHRSAISYLQLALALHMKAGSQEFAYVIANIARQHRILGDTAMSIRLHRLALAEKLKEGADVDGLLNTAVPLAEELQRGGDYPAAIATLNRLSKFAGSRGKAVPATVQRQCERLSQINRLAQALRASDSLVSTSAAAFDSDLAQILTVFVTQIGEADLTARFEFHCRLARALYEEPVCMFAESVDQYRSALALSRAGANRDAHLRTLGAAAAAAAELGDLASQAEFLGELLAATGFEDVFSDKGAAQRMQYVLMLLWAEDEPTARKHADLVLSDDALQDAAYAEAIVSQASVLQRQGYHDIANRCFEAVIEANASSASTAAARIRLAKTMLAVGQPLQALDLLQQNLELVSRLDARLMAMTWFGLAHTRLRLGDVEGGVEAFEQLQRAADDLSDPAIHDRVAEVAAELTYQTAALLTSHDAITAALSQPDVAKSETGQKAIMALRIRLRQINSDSNRDEAALLRASLVSILLSANQLSEADAEAKAALRVCRSSDRRDLYGFVLHELGVLNAMTYRLESAERLFATAVRYKDKYGVVSRWTSLANLFRVRNLLGRLSPPDEVGALIEHLDELPSGERKAGLLQFALSLERESPRAAEEFALRFFAESGTPEPEHEAWAYMLQARLALAREDLSAAWKATLEALSVAESARRQASARSREHLDAVVDGTAGFAMNLAWKSDPPQGLALAERMKSRGLLEQFGLWGVDTPDALPQQLRARESHLLASLRYEERSALFPNDRAAMATLGLNPLATEQQLAEFWLTLPEEWQDYGRLRAGSPATLEQLRALVRDRHPCHHVVITPTVDGVYIFQLSPRGELIGSDRYAMSRQSLANLVAEYNRALSHRADPDRDVVAALTDLLTRAVSPVPADTALAIVPSGPLMHLAFPATTIGNDLLVERNTVAVLPSLTLLNYLRSEAVATPEKAAVYGDSLSDLPAARNEATWVAKRFGTDAMLGPAVTRRGALAGFPRARIVHVAGHAEYRAASAAQAGFVLADRTILSGRDLLDSSIGAELAFLSGCETGRLAVDSGDELTGLPVGFIRSGVPCIAAAAWRVNDDSTRLLVRKFYRAAVPGTTYAAALRSAQLDILADSKRQHPYHWAAFQLWGCATVGPALS